MSDCPDCENKVVEENVEKTECECGCSCGCEAEAKTEEKAPKSPAVKVLLSLARIVGLTVVVALILFFVAKPQIMRWWYEESESSAVKSKIAAMLDEGLAKSGATYTIEYFDEGEGQANGYKIVVTDKDGKEVDNFKMYAQYDEAKGELNVVFTDANVKGEGITWESIKGRLKRQAAREAAEKAAPAAEKAAPAAEKAAPAAEKAAPAAK